jgi:hypothetical protein
MASTSWQLTISVGVILLSATTTSAQLAPPTGPPFSEVEATWTAFWQHISLGDIEGAVKHVHSSRRHLLPTAGDLRKMQQAADQMAFCRIDPVPSPIQVRKDEVFYPVHCRHGGETAEGQLGMRRDFDGVWRISAL